MSLRSRISISKPGSSSRRFEVASDSRCAKAFLAAGLVSAAFATVLTISSVSGFQVAAYAQAPASGKQIGTVKAVLPNKLTITTDAGKDYEVNVVDDARVVRLAPGSTDLKTAAAITLGDIEVGDRVLVTGHEDAADAFTASRVILMKSSDISQKHEAEQEDWQKRGSGGLVSSVDPAAGVLAITARGNKVTVKTSPTTTYRRYSGDSIKYQDATPGTLDQIQVGDQLRVRGTKTPDAPAAGGAPAVTIQAEEIVSGSFKNLAGTIVSIDQAKDTLTVKDLATKKTFSVKVTSNSNIRALPPEAASRFAARAKGGQAGAGAGGERPAGGGPGSGGPGSGGPGQGGGSAGGDLSQLIGRLPEGSLGDLHVGEALMVVASQPQAGSDSLVAITLLSGVEPILAATPAGASTMTLSPWNFGGGEGGGA